ncbi:MAG: hypothetical protein QXW40_03870 [Thermofilum sp.]
MRFLDADVFIYACYKPRRQLTQKEGQMKELAKRIISDVSQGRERVVATVVHLSLRLLAFSSTACRRRIWLG